MEGNSNEQVRDSLASNANDWITQHEPDLRQRIIFAIVEKLKICFPNHSQNDINNTAFKFEGKIYDMSTDKSDYLQKISEKIMIFDEKFKSVQSGSSVNGPNTTPDPAAQAMNQGQSLPTSLPYMQPPTSQQWFPQNNIHSNLNIHESSSGYIGQGVGVHSNLLTGGSQRQFQGRQQLLPQPQQQTQSSTDMFQLLKEQIHHLQPPYMQQQNHQQSLLKQPIQQQLSPHTSLSTFQQSFPESYSLSGLTSSGQQNSQFLPRPQFPTQRFHSNHQQQMVVPSQEQEHQQLISQLMNGQDTLQNHLSSRQTNWDQQGAFTVSPPQQNNITTFQEMAQLQKMNQQQHLYTYSNNASALPSQQNHYMHGGQSGNFNVYGTSLLGTQDQEVGQSQPMMLQQYQQNRILQQHLDDTQRFQTSGSFHQTQNVADQQNQPYQLQRAPPANPSTSQDYTGKMVNASGWDWQEETYQKIKALKEKYLPVLSTLLQKLSDKLREVDSLPQQKMQHETIEKLRAGKSTLELVIVFLNVSRNNVSESHRDRFSLYEEQVLRFTKNQQTMTQRPMQHQQSQTGHQVHVSPSLDNNHTSMPRSFQTRPNMEPKDENNIVSSSGNAVLPSSMFQQNQFHQLQTQHQQTNQLNDQRMRQGVNIKAELLQQHLLPSDQFQIQNYSSPQFLDHQILPTTFHNTGASSVSPRLGDIEKPLSVESPVSHDYQLQTATQEALTQSVTDMSSVISLADKLAGSVHSIGASSDLSARTKFRLQQEETNPTKRRKITTLPLDITSQTVSYKQLSSLETEADSTASSGSKVHKIEPGCALLQEIKETNGTLVETVVNICNEEAYPSEVTPGTIVTCSNYKSGHIIQPLRLLVPLNYPYSPVVILETVPSDSSLQKCDDLSAKTRSRLSLSMKEVSGPMSLKEIAQVWDVCVRATMAEYAERHGGGTFSSKYGGDLGAS